MTRILKDGKKENSFPISICSGKGTEFYGMMGKYFAEPGYKKEMPYLVNRTTNTWFISRVDGEVIGFGAVNELKNKIVFEHSYVEVEYREKGIWKAINEARFEYARYKLLPMEVITKEPHLQVYWVTQGFSIFKKNGRFIYLRKEPDTCIII